MFNFDDDDFKKSRKLVIIVCSVILLISSAHITLSDQTIFDFKLPKIEGSRTKDILSLILFYSIFAFSLRGYEHAIEIYSVIGKNKIDRMEYRIRELERRKKASITDETDGLEYMKIDILEQTKRIVFAERIRMLLSVIASIILDFSIPIFLIILAYKSYNPSVNLASIF